MQKAFQDELAKFISESKNEVIEQAGVSIESLKIWQENAIANFDMMRQYIIKHNLENLDIGLVQEKSFVQHKQATASGSEALAALNAKILTHTSMPGELP